MIQHLVFRRSGPSSEAIGCQLSDGDALYLGAYYGTCNMRCNDGQLNEVRVFDRALTAEIRALYTNET